MIAAGVPLTPILGAAGGALRRGRLGIREIDWGKNGRERESERDLWSRVTLSQGEKIIKFCSYFIRARQILYM